MQEEPRSVSPVHCTPTPSRGMAQPSACLTPPSSCFATTGAPDHAIPAICDHPSTPRPPQRLSFYSNQAGLPARASFCTRRGGEGGADRGQHPAGGVCVFVCVLDKPLTHSSRGSGNVGIGGDCQVRLLGAHTEVSVFTGGPQPVCLVHQPGTWIGHLNELTM